MASDEVEKDNEEHLDLDDLSVELEDDDEDSVDGDKNENRLLSNDKNKSNVVSNHKWAEHKEFESSLTECLTISKSKISIVTELSMKYLNRYKDIVHYIEKFIRKGKTINDTKLPQLFIIDSICRAEIKEHKNSHNKFIKRFGRNIDKTFHALCRGPPSDKPSIKRVFTLWNKERWFPSDKMKAIMLIIKTFKSDEHHSSHNAHHHTHHKNKHKIKSKHKSKKKHKKKKKKKSKHKEKQNGNATATATATATASMDNNGLLKSLQSLTNNDDDDDGDEEEEGGNDDDEDDNDREDEDDNMQIKLERLKAAQRRESSGIGLKRKINNSLHEGLPDRKKIKIDNNINHQNQMNHNALHHIMSQPPIPPIHPQMMNPHPHYMYSHAHAPPPPPPHAHPYMYPHHSQPQPPPPPQPQAQPAPMTAHSHSQHQQYGIGWELSPDQLGVSPDRYRVLSCTIYVGFWNDVHVDIDKLRQEGNEFGPVLKIMPHPTKPPHKHAFIQFGSRVIAENAKSGLRKRFNHLQFVQKVGWGRPPKLVKESFKFDTGIGEILRSEAPHIRFNTQPQPQQQQQQPPTQMQTQTQTQAPQPTANHNPNNANFVNIERQRMINGTGAGNPQYTPQQPMQYHPYNSYPPPQPQQPQPQPQPQQAHHPYY